MLVRHGRAGKLAESSCATCGRSRRWRDSIVHPRGRRTHDHPARAEPHHPAVGRRARGHASRSQFAARGDDPAGRTFFDHVERVLAELERGVRRRAAPGEYPPRVQLVVARPVGAGHRRPVRAGHRDDGQFDPHRRCAGRRAAGEGQYRRGAWARDVDRRAGRAPVQRVTGGGVFCSLAAGGPDRSWTGPRSRGGRLVVNIASGTTGPWSWPAGAGPGNSGGDNEFRRVDRVRRGRSRHRRDPRCRGQAQHSPRCAVHRAAWGTPEPGRAGFSAARPQRRAAPLRRGGSGERSRV